MKSTTIKLIISALIFGACCTEQVPNPLLGLWDMQYSEWNLEDSLVYTFHKDAVKMQVKAFSAGHYSWIIYDPTNDTTDMNHISGGSGSYVMMGDTLIESIIISPWENTSGSKTYSIIKINEDSLIQTFYPQKMLTEKWWGKEIYLRLK